MLYLNARRRMPRRPRLLILTIGALCVALVAAGCGGSSGGGKTAAPAASKTGTVVIGYENNGSVDPQQAALSLGLYKKYIHAPVKLVYFDSGPAALTALGSGSVDIMTGIGNPPVASALINRVPLEVVWAEELSQTDQALVVSKGSGISSIADLKGKTVATVVGSTSSYALAAALKKAGVPAGDVHLRNMTPVEIANAWKAGEIDAAYIWYPVLGQLIASGGRVLATDANVASSAPIYNLSVVNKAWASKNVSVVDGFVSANNAALSALKSNRSAVLAKMAKDTGETVTEANKEVGTTRWFTAKEQLGPDALGSSDSHSLVATSLLSAAQYLHTLDAGQAPLKSVSGAINRSFVSAVSSGK